MELLKQEQIFDELVNERRFQINKLREEINFNNLIYYYTGKSAPKYFIVLKDPIIIYNDIKKEEKIQEESQLEINEILKRHPNYKSEDQISTMKNIKKLFNGQEKVIQFYNDYTGMTSEAKYKSIHGEGLKTLNLYTYLKVYQEHLHR